MDNGDYLLNATSKNSSSEINGTINGYAKEVSTIYEE